FRLLPWEYGVRNLFRRPGRTLLTLLGLTLVVLLVLVVVGFLRGLEHSLAVGGDPRVVLVHAPASSENIETSSVKAQTAPVLAAGKLGCREADLAVGRSVTFEERTWAVSGRFAAAGSALESELWCPLEELQTAAKRQDLSLVALTLAPGSSFADVDEFCKERLD